MNKSYLHANPKRSLFQYNGLWWSRISYIYINIKIYKYMFKYIYFYTYIYIYIYLYYEFI